MAGMFFSDKAKITVRSGKGGDGHVSFRREKFVPAGGPDGGDGGKGGDVVFEVDQGLNTLASLRHTTKYIAGDGKNGEKCRRRGKDGEDVVIQVPEGTVIREADSGRVIVDMSDENRRFVLLKGGRGGNGNQHYATSSMQAPKYAQPGQPARQLELSLELKMIADVGLVGFPNAGKSTFLSHVSNARPKIGDYPFTTLQPSLGVVELDGDTAYVIADIPGLIEGASCGAGLGFDFLRHIERTKVLIHIVDAAGVEGRDPVEDVHTIQKELRRYQAALLERPQVIAANKVDIIADSANSSINRLREAFAPEGLRVFPISAVTGEGLRDLLRYVAELLAAAPAQTTVFEQEYFPEQALSMEGEPFTVSYDGKTQEYVVTGPRIDKMLGYTNLESEKGFAFFQNFLKESGILEKLEQAGVEEGDTVRIDGMSFDYVR